MMRILFSLLAIASAFLFPYPATLILSFVAGLFVPVIPLIVGILVDLYYHVPGASPLPFATLIGASVSIAAVLVRRFVKARIID